MTAKIGDIQEYTIPENTQETVVSAGDVFPMIVVSVNATDGTVSGTVFLNDGSTRYVHIVPDAPAEPTPAPAPAPTPAADPVPQSVETAISELTPVERAELLAQLQASVAADTAASTPTAPASAPVDLGSVGQSSETGTATPSTPNVSAS